MPQTRLGTKKPDDIGAAHVEICEVTHVNSANYTVDLLTTIGHRPIPDVPFATPYVGPNGTGINFMPEMGVTAYCFIPGDASGPFVLGFVRNGSMRTKDHKNAAGLTGNVEEAADGDGPDYSGGRLPAEPGDIILDTSDENFVIVRKGGIVQLGATTLAQTIYIPIENLIRNFFQRYQSISPLGEIEWGHASVENGIQDGEDTAVLISFSAREAAQDENMSVEVRVGRLTSEVLDMDDDSEHEMADAKTLSGLGMSPGIGLLSITVNPGGDGVKYTFQLDKAGNNFIRTEAGVHVEIVDGLFVRADKGFRLEQSATAYLALSESATFKAMVQSMVLEAVAAISLKAPSTTIDSPNVTLGAGPLYYPVVVDNGKLLTWIKSHVHVETGGTTATPTFSSPLPVGHTSGSVRA